VWTFLRYKHTTLVRRRINITTTTKHGSSGNATCAVGSSYDETHSLLDGEITAVDDGLGGHGDSSINNSAGLLVAERRTLQRDVLASTFIKNEWAIRK
jgi:hypothetical protein